MVGIVFTTADEASPFVRTYTDGRFDSLAEGSPIQTEDVVIATTGKGKINATLAVERLLRTHDLDVLLHAGTCTALNEELDSGTVVGISSVLEGDRVELDAPTYPRMPLECPFDLSVEATLVSQDHLTEAADPSYWERIADVRDETGYAVAYVAAQHGVPCHIVKAVEAVPGKDEEGTSETQKGAIEAIASFLQSMLENRRESEAQ